MLILIRYFDIPSGREVIERGVADSRTNSTKNAKEIRTKYGLPE